MDRNAVAVKGQTTPTESTYSTPDVVISTQKQQTQQERLKGQPKELNRWVLRAITFVSIAYMLYYLWWRVTQTLNHDVLWFSIWLWAAEAFGVLNYALFSWMTQRIAPTRPYKPPKEGLSVDIFVPTYNEDLEILEATLTGCASITYPHTTYVLDDGRREEVRRLAEKMGCKYIARPSNEHAKAGNINYALSKTSGEFIVILDADMVPQPNLLDRTLGYFEDERLAFIQLPQEFYNLDSIQHDPRSPEWHEQALFFRVIQPGKNYSNSAFWCGSPSILRRKALEEIGGVAVETITEDIHTSVRLHSRGWSSYFLNEPLVFGIAPQTIKAYLLQRLRWAQGTMQLYRSKESPLWIPGLSLKQRLSYFASFLAYVESLQKLTFILIPIGIMVFGVLPISVRISEFLIRWLPYFALNLLANQVGGRGVFRYFRSEMYSFLRMVVFVQAHLILFIKKPLRFHVTPKSVDSSVYKQERSALRIHLLLVTMILGAILLGISRFVSHHYQRMPLEAFLIVAFWGGYNAFVIGMGVLEVLKRLHARKHYRFRVDLIGKVCDVYQMYCTDVRIKNLSISGAQLECDQPLSTQLKELYLCFDTQSYARLMLPIRKIAYQTKHRNGRMVTGIFFGELEGNERHALFRYLFVDSASLAS